VAQQVRRDPLRRGPPALVRQRARRKESRLDPLRLVRPTGPTGSGRLIPKAARRTRRSCECRMARCSMIRSIGPLASQFTIRQG